MGRFKVGVQSIHFICVVTWRCNDLIVLIEGAHRHLVGLEWSVPQIHDGSLELSYSDYRLIIPLSVTTVT